MILDRTVHLPRIARLSPGALEHLATDAAALGLTRVLLLSSAGLPAPILSSARSVLARGPVAAAGELEVAAAGLASVTEATTIAQNIARAAARIDGVVALGGGRAIDIGKYAAHLAAVPFVAVPTSLSNDGFASPSASLADDTGRRSSVPCGGPAGVIVDTAICAAAPRSLTLAGVGDVVAKLTALADWHLAERNGTDRVDGVSAAVSESAVAEVECVSRFDEPGIGRLARALLLGGVAMAIAGSSRPCSGSEHLVSHALDRLKTPPGSHGLQVGLAAYLCSQLPGSDPAVHARIAAVLDRLHFWPAAAGQRLTPELLVDALKLAPSIKPGYFTVLSSPESLPRAREILNADRRLLTALHG